MKTIFKKIFAFISLLLLYFINVFGEIPKNVIINNSKSIEYETIDNEKLKLIISIDGVKYSEELFYAYYKDGNCIEIPVPKYLSVYKNSIVLIQGNGTSYRNIIVYQKENDKIIKRSFENSLSMSTLPRNFENYIILYNQNPVLIFHNQDETLFYDINKKIEKEIAVVEINDTKVTFTFVDNNFEEISIETFKNEKLK